MVPNSDRSSKRHETFVLGTPRLGLPKVSNRLRLLEPSPTTTSPLPRPRVKSTVFRTRVVVCCVFWSSLAVGSEAKRPIQPPFVEANGVPAPDPAAPVDYILWYNSGNASHQYNAFDVYLAAYELLTRFEGDWGLTLIEPWSDHAAVSSWLLANQEGLEIFRRAAARRDFFFRLSKNQELAEPRLHSLLLAWEKPGWLGHLNGSKGLVAAGWRAWLAGDEGLLRQNALLALRAAHHFQDTRWPISRLIGDGAARPAYVALRRALARSDDPAAWAASLAASLERDDPPAPPFGHACSLLRVEFWDLCQRVFLPRGADGRWQVHRRVIHALAPRLVGEPEALAEQLEAIGMPTSLSESDAYYDALEHWNALPFHVAVGRPFPLDQLRESSDNPLHRLQASVTAETRARVERTFAERRATHLIVHLTIYKARFGAYPERLGQLTVADLPTLRRDPFSGRDFVYRRSGADFVLYSLAYNLTDEGGRHDPEWTEEDYVFWPVQE